MAVAPRPLTSWSYSRFSLYQQCPYKFQQSVLLKKPEPKGDALIRGAAIHEEAEKYLKGEGRTVPASCKTFDKEFKRLRAKRKKNPAAVVVEDTWAFTNTWGPSRWDDWNNCWLRVKLDVAERDERNVEITDWKTGKFRPDNREDYVQQLRLYAVGALAVFAHIPDLRVSARLVYLDVGVVYPEPDAREEFTPTDLPALQRDWTKAVKPMFNDKKFAPKPNQWCRWCAFSKAQGGDCKF